MTKAIATRAAVYAAADALKARGIDPTYELIVKALGGGSNATVGPHLETWRQLAQPPERPVPEEVELRARVLLDAVWTAARRETIEEMDRAKQLSDAQIQQGAQALASSIAINQGLEAERDELLRRVAKVEDTCSDLRIQLRQVERLEAELARALEVAEQRRAQCDAAAQEAFAQAKVNEELRSHGRQLLEQLSRRQPRVRAVAKAN